jgi:hypothetical protein
MSLKLIFLGIIGQTLAVYMPLKQIFRVVLSKTTGNGDNKHNIECIGFIITEKLD